MFRLCSWPKNLKIERKEVPFTQVRQGKYCIGILTYCNWGERCDRLSRGSLRCNSSMIWSPWFSGETPVHSAKVTTWRKSRFFSNRILQTQGNLRENGDKNGWHNITSWCLWLYIFKIQFRYLDNTLQKRKRADSRVS